MPDKSNVVVIGDVHEPFCRKDYLQFCFETSRRFNCGQAVCVGDLVDLHSISYHEHSPNGYSPKQEIEKSRVKIKEWAKAFPRLLIAKGNHDILFERKAITNGIPQVAIKSYKEIFELPDKWEFEWKHYICNVVYEHGTGYGGRTPHIQAAVNNRKSTVIGHCHSVAGVEYLANDDSLIFGMSAGCGIDRMQYAFWYGKDFKYKPVISCGVVIGGREAIVVPMKI